MNYVHLFNLHPHTHGIATVQFLASKIIVPARSSNGLKLQMRNSPTADDKQMPENLVFNNEFNFGLKLINNQKTSIAIHHLQPLFQHISENNTINPSNHFTVVATTMFF